MNEKRTASIDDCSMEDWDNASKAGAAYARELTDAYNKSPEETGKEFGDDLLELALENRESDIIFDDSLIRPLDKQVGGSHYKDKGIQPLEMTYKNFGYQGLKAAVYTKVNKYLLRDKGNEIEDINKAIHCLEILLQYLEE